VSGVDLVDQTPVLDIKPYHPADSVDIAHLTVPPWLALPPKRSLRVVFEEGVLTALRATFERADFELQFYSGVEEVVTAIEQTVGLDPRTIHSIAKHDEGVYGFPLDRLDICFRMVAEEEGEGAAKGSGEGEDAQGKGGLLDGGEKAGSAADGGSSALAATGAWPPDSDVGGSGCRPLPPHQQRLNNREHASVFKITYFPPKALRPKMRTREWYRENASVV